MRTRADLTGYGWDGLVALEVLAQLESRLSITLNLRRFSTVQDIGELVTLVAARSDPRRVKTPVKSRKRPAF